MATVGSIASNAYGQFRATNDVDLVLAIESGDAPRFSEVFPPEEFYCPPPDIIQTEAARAERGHFKLIHHETGFKADVYVAGRDALQRWAFEHRREIRVDDIAVWVAPPEYVIIGKREFYQEGRSEKHLRDIRGMLAVTDVDRSFLETEIARCGLADVWRKCSDFSDDGCDRFFP